MACRCSEISKCERDMSLLGGDVAQKMNTARSKNDSTMSKYPTVSQSLSEAVFAQNFERVDQRFTAVKKQHDSYIDALQIRRGSENQRVRNRLDSYRNEDRRYHEMMAQKVK